MKSTRLLRNEHLSILRALDIIDVIASRAESGESPERQDVESILQFMHVYGDNFHQEKEEAILFPAMVKASNCGEYENLCHATFEHNRQRSLLEGIEDALMCRNCNDFVYYERRLSEILRIHVKDEEEELFKRADALFTEEEDRRIANELVAFRDPPWLARCQERVAELGAKYLTEEKVPIGRSGNPTNQDCVSNYSEGRVPGENVKRRVGTL